MTRFLVTSGSSRERIDRVRDWGSVFAGSTGYAIARALAELGEVELVTNNRNHLAELPTLSLPHLIRGRAFNSHRNLIDVLDALMLRSHYDAVFMTAAIADYEPTGAFEVVSREPLEGGGERWVVRDVQAGKIKSTHEQLALLGRPTQKVIDLFRTRWGFRGTLVKFKLEVGLSREDLISIGERSRQASAADYLVANNLEMVSGEAAGAYLLSDGGAEWVARDDLPRRLLDVARDAIRQSPPS
jgi:phosphopantothenoylcysteine synthetase/decarboxylase